MKPLDRWGAMACSVLLVWGGLLARNITAQPAPPMLQIFMSDVEIKGSTTTEKLAPPPCQSHRPVKGVWLQGPG